MYRSIVVVISLLFISYSVLFSSTKVLYNFATREVITKETVEKGTATWSLLDAQNSNFSSYSHPAYYNSISHEVLDSSVGSRVGNWVLFTPPKALYNSTSKVYITPQEIQSGSTDWMILDSNSEFQTGYSHPAYYNKSEKKVLDSSSGSVIGDWKLIEYSYPALITNDVNSTDSTENYSSGKISLVLYNIETKKVITPAQVESGSTDWLLLSPAKYPDKYTHPAFYNLTFHRVVENLETDVENGWTLKKSDSVDPNATNPDLDKVLFNTTTQETISRVQIEQGGTEWIILPPGFVGNDGSTYTFPAYYNQTTKGVLDNSKGAIENGWVLSNLKVSVNVGTHILSNSTSSSVGGGGTVTGSGSYDLKSNIVLTAKSSPGYFFSYWSGGVSGSLNTVSFVASQDFDITANFTIDSNDDDFDGLSNYEELVVYSTNSVLADTDKDGLNDKEEVLAGLDPTSSNKALIDQIAASLGLNSGEDSPYTQDWFYLPNRGWLLTNNVSYPYFYDNSINGWLYFRSGGEKPNFYDYTTQSWITMESSD